MSGFVEALAAAPVPVIAEVKARDSGGRDLLGGRGPAEVADAYREAGAPCLSVVTGSWFGGTVEMLRAVREVSGVPLLQKDFLTRERHLRRAAELGVSAVLLTAQLLPVSVLRSLTERALLLGLTPFVEVVSEEEIADVAHPAECVIAVNNKDIRTGERGDGDLARSLRLSEAVLATGTRCAVSASGVGTPADAAALLSAGYSGLLVGTALLDAVRPASWFAEVAGMTGAVR
ncbi:hypothetical protein [Amycolatopsis sp. CA-230715]|uniref:hypothetical protein n=1 Tax=Amycolatopsis sp. CA-230715 TaxID=2745196 RepID=UPI001C01266B|nr:hypothetical protein [Amycolatopsis sp. CA-230715]